MSILLILSFLVPTVGAVALVVPRWSRRRLAAMEDADRGGLLSIEGQRNPVLPTVSVILPTLNEAASLPWVFENIPDWVSEVVLVDGLSTDSTEQIARRLRPDIVVVHQHARGKGAAVRAGFAAASGEIIVMLDADGSTDPREMDRFVDALTSGGDFVKGSRHILSGGSADFTRLRSAGNQAFVLITNLLYRSRFTDLCYGYCAFWRYHLDALALTADGFEIETQLILNAVKAGLDIREVPSYELQRRAGTSNLHAVRDGTRVLRTMLTARRSPDPTNPRVAPPIGLIEVEMPIARRAADRDSRRGERRQLGTPVACYAGPERRLRNRRDTTVTVRVLRAVAKSGPEPSPHRAA